RLRERDRLRDRSVGRDLYCVAAVCAIDAFLEGERGVAGGRIDRPDVSHRAGHAVAGPHANGLRRGGPQQGAAAECERKEAAQSSTISASRARCRAATPSSHPWSGKIKLRGCDPSNTAEVRAGPLEHTSAREFARAKPRASPPPPREGVPPILPLVERPHRH